MKMLSGAVLMTCRNCTALFSNLADKCMRPRVYRRVKKENENGSFGKMKSPDESGDFPTMG
jgi:hypothetical protein